MYISFLGGSGVLHHFADSLLHTHCNGATQAVGVQGVENLPGSTVAVER